MGRRKTNISDIETQENIPEVDTAPESIATEPVETVEIPVNPAIPEPKPVDPPVQEVKPAAPKAAPKPAPVVIAPKKRIRVRPSQKKKLSVAVLCTNPMTRRFI